MTYPGMEFIDGLAQERRNSSALAMELRLPAPTHRYIAFYSIKTPRIRTYLQHTHIVHIHIYVYLKTCI